MKTPRFALLLGAVIAVVVVVIVAGAAKDDSATSTTSTAPTTLSESGEEPLSTLPTPESVQTLVFERALSECSSYNLASLAGKYNVAVPTEENIAQAVGEGWARQFNAGQDAVADGRDGCFQGFSRG